MPQTKMITLHITATLGQLNKDNLSINMNINFKLLNYDFRRYDKINCIIIFD